MLSGDVVQQVSDLKQQTGGDILINGSATLVQTLMEHDLIDEYRLFVNPVVLGGGTPFFPQGRERLKLELVETQTFGSRVVYLRYRRTTVD